MVTRTAVLFIVCLGVLGLSSAALVAQNEQAQRVPPVLKVYDIRDLVFPVPDYTPPGMQLPGQPMAPGGGLWGGGASGAGGAGAGEEQGSLTADGLVDLIKGTVDPGTWEEGSGNSMRQAEGALVVLHEQKVQQQVENLLTELRKQRGGRMVSVHVIAFTPTAEAAGKMARSENVLAVSEEQKSALMKLVGTKVVEARLLAMEGEKVGLVSTGTVEFAQKFGKDVEVNQETAGMTAWARPLVLKDGSVMVALGADIAMFAGKPTTWTRPPLDTLAVAGTYRVPDGAMLLTSGGTLMGEKPAEVYLLIRVQVVPAQGK